MTVCKFSNDGSRLFSGHKDGSICEWDADRGVLISQCSDQHEHEVCDMLLQVFYDANSKVSSVSVCMTPSSV